MQIRLAIVAAVLAISPTFALGFGNCNGVKHDVQAMSCAEGTTFDAEKGTCVPVVSG